MSNQVSADHQRIIRKLSLASPLSSEEQVAIASLPLRSRDFEKRADLVRQGSRPHEACMIIEGVVCREKYISRGRRQILSLHVPGDFPDLQSLFLDVMDCGLSALTGGRCVFISHESLRALIRSHPRVGEALWRDTLVDASIFREGMVLLGRRTARERVAHLICELAVRLEAFNPLEGHQFRLPLTQADFADALGLTGIHVNRILQALRGEGLIRTQGKLVEIADWPELRAAADFTTDYLHLPPGAITPNLQERLIAPAI